MARSAGGVWALQDLLPRDLDRFIDELAAEAPLLNPIDGRFCDVLTAGKKAQTSTSAVVQALLDGHLKCRGRLSTASGIMQIMVALDEVRLLRDRPFNADTFRTIEVCRGQIANFDQRHPDDATEDVQPQVLHLGAGLAQQIQDPFQFLVPFVHGTAAGVSMEDKENRRKSFHFLGTGSQRDL